MNRYILSETIRRFQEILAEDISPEERMYAAAEVASMQRSLALMDAAELGVQKYPHQIGPASTISKKRLQRLLDGSSESLLVIDPRPGLHLVDMTASFAMVTMADRVRAIGGNLFDIYPENPEDPGADGVSSVLSCLRAAASTGQTQVTEVQRYDVRDADGPFVERYWRPAYIPMFDDAGALVWLLVRLEDVTTLRRRTMADPAALL